jgi:hypothetical protein
MTLSEWIGSAKILTAGAEGGLNATVPLSLIAAWRPKVEPNGLLLSATVATGPLLVVKMPHAIGALGLECHRAIVIDGGAAKAVELPRR